MFWLFVVKEFKSIARDPKLLIAMVVIPLILVAVLYFIIGQGLSQQIEQAVKESDVIAIVDMDRGNYSQLFADYMKSIGLEIIYIDAENIDTALNVFKNVKAKILYIIPLGFSYNLSNFKPAVLQIYVKFTSLTLGEGGVVDSALKYLSIFNNYIIKTRANEKGIPLEFIDKTITGSIYGLIVDKIISNPSGFVFTITIQSVFIPLIVIMLVVFSAQLVATSMAIEKEEKMFETLLSLPVSRMSVIGAKLFVSIAISIVYMIGYSLALFGIFFSSFPASSSIPNFDQLQRIDVSFTILPIDITIYIILNVAGLAIFMISIALLLSLFAEDVRSAQAIIGNIVGPIIVFVYLPMFIDISVSPTTRLIFSLIPVVNTVFLHKMAIIQDNISLVIASISNIVYGIIMFIVIKKIVNSETIFTLRLPIGKKKT